MTISTPNSCCSLIWPYFYRSLFCILMRYSYPVNHSYTRLMHAPCTSLIVAVSRFMRSIRSLLKRGWCRKYSQLISLSRPSSRRLSPDYDSRCHIPQCWLYVIALQDGVVKSSNYDTAARLYVREQDWDLVVEHRSRMKYVCWWVSSHDEVVSVGVFAMWTGGYDSLFLEAMWKHTFLIKNPDVLVSWHRYASSLGLRGAFQSI